MTFEELLDHAMAMLQRRGRVTYRALKLQFSLDDDRLEALKDELLYAHPHVVADDGRGLVWTGDARPTPTPESSPATDQERLPLSYTPPHLTEKILEARLSLEGERKQVTVLFADLKGSMELLADRDPEEARALLDPVLERMMAAVHRYEGTVNQVMGDGIMALFGAPIAHEDHAVRACYAALAMQEAIRHYSAEVRRSHDIEMQIRVGLNSGEVVVRSIGNDLHMDYSAIGQTTHLAARMEQLAAPGSIRLTAETLRHVEGLVQVTPLGPVPVKGLPDPVEVFELMGAGPARTCLQAWAARGLTPFVGRHTERQVLREAWERAGMGHGQLVAVIGEPGVGKSRLFSEFLTSLLTQGWLVLEANAVSYGEPTPYLPIRDLLQAYFQIDDRDDEHAIREKVDKVLTLDVALQPARPAVLALLDVRVDDPEWQTLDPAQRRLRTIESVRRLLLRQSQVQPLLVIVENLHWIDAETRAVLDSLIESLPTARLLLLVNYRPEYEHRWGHKTYYTQLRLDPLPPERAEELLQALLGDNAGLGPLKRLLRERTEGNPLFLEESVRTLVESGVLAGERGAYRLAKGLESKQVPATVQAVLAARIDRLTPADKRLLQSAAVIGTEVPYLLLQAIAELPEEALRGGLARLQGAEFLYETALFPDLEYTFKHALTHEVAYGSLLQERRRALHGRIVETIEALYADRLAEQLERLAHHAVRGEVWGKAVGYLHQAGAKALERSAHREASGRFEQALDALQQLPESRDMREQAIDLRFALRTALMPSGGFGRILDVLREAEAVAKALDDPRRLGQIALFMIMHFFYMGDPDRAVAAGQRALALATASGEVGLQAVANAYLGMAYQTQGEHQQATDCYRQTVASLNGPLLYERFGQVLLPAVFSRAYLAWCHAEVGKFAEGIAIGEEALRVAEAVGHRASLVYAYYGAALPYLRQGDLSQALPLLERAMGICRDADLPLYFPTIARLLGLAYALAGQVADALPLLDQAVEQNASLGRRSHHALLVATLGEGLLLAGHLEEARHRAREALALAGVHQERGHEAWAFRLLGEIAAQSEPPAVELAEGYYHQALALADELGMRPLLAHCHRGLGTLYAKIGRPEQAHSELTSAIELYRAMAMTFWLPQAEAALAQVEGR